MLVMQRRRIWNRKFFRKNVVNCFNAKTTVSMRPEATRIINAEAA